MSFDKIFDLTAGVYFYFYIIVEYLTLGQILKEPKKETDEQTDDLGIPTKRVAKIRLTSDRFHSQAAPCRRRCSTRLTEAEKTIKLL